MGKIRNFEELAQNAKRKAALEIAEAGLAAIETGAVMKRLIKPGIEELTIKDELIFLAGAQRIWAVGVGKCALEASRALKEILGDRLAGGIVLDVKPRVDLGEIRVFQGTHPWPSKENVESTAQIIDFLKGLNESDLVIFIISGGGSTLLCSPQEMGLDEETRILKALFKAGADIVEINTLRKHLSLARGGHLAKYAYPARAVSLIFSDVPGNNLEFIASGPTVKDSTTVEEAQKILKKYKISQGLDFKDYGLIETPKEDKYFERVTNILLVSNRLALEAMAKKAEDLGYQATICTDSLEEEASEAGKRLVKELAGTTGKLVRLYGGETTVAIKGKGMGGRNQELTLSALRFVGEDKLVLSMASDGRDNTDFAGAIGDKLTLERAGDLGLKIDEYLENNDSYHFFEKVKDYIMTGDTGSNVADLVIFLKE